MLIDSMKGVFNIVKVQVQLNGETLLEFQMNKGIKQGDSRGPVLVRRE